LEQPELGRALELGAVLYGDRLVARPLPWPVHLHRRARDQHARRLPQRLPQPDDRQGEVMASASDRPLLEVANLAVQLPTGRDSHVDAVRAVSLTVGRGERVGIVGESGSGKSVTGRAIAGLLPQNPRVHVSGSIRFDGDEMVGANQRAWQEIRSSRVGMIFQDPLTYLNPTMRIGRQVRESLPAGKGRGGKADAAEVVRFLTLAGLSDAAEVAQRFPHE